MTLRRPAKLGWDAVLFELAIYRSLARWIVRRPDVPAGAAAIGYAKDSTPMLWLWIYGSATEVVLFEILLRNLDAGWARAIRFPVLVIGIWGLLWMVGMMASYKVRPHLLWNDRLRIRSGARTWATVPLSAVASSKTVNHDLPGVVKSLHVDDALLLIGVSSRTNLELTLTEPTDLDTVKGPVHAIERVGLWVDDPKTISTLLRDALRTTPESA